MHYREITLRDDQSFITLNVVLKLSDLISTGGMAKIYLQTNDVLVNKEKENRRGRKLFRGDIIETENLKILIK